MSSTKAPSIGKGIYDVDAIERRTQGRFSENRILSHDLLEGCYARAGLVSDTELFEEFPRATAPTWRAGDAGSAATGSLRDGCWRRVKGPDGRRELNPLSMLSQWKLFDNLRRSLVPAALAVAADAGMDRAAVGMVLDRGRASCILLCAERHCGTWPIWPTSRPRCRSDNIWLPSCDGARRHVLQALLSLAFLPYESFYSLDAIIRTIWRMLITHRRLLEWKPFSEVDRRAGATRRHGLACVLSRHGDRPAIAAAVWIDVSLTRPAVLAVAGPILLLWGHRPPLPGG